MLKTRRCFLQSEQQVATRCFAGFIVRENKRFLLFLVQQQIAESAAELFCIRFYSKTKRKPVKKKYRSVTFY